MGIQDNDSGTIIVQPVQHIGMFHFADMRVPESLRVMRSGEPESLGEQVPEMLVEIIGNLKELTVFFSGNDRARLIITTSRL